MNNKIKEQLISIRKIVVGPHSNSLGPAIGKIINENREYVLNSLDENEISIMEKFVKPIEIKEGFYWCSDKDALTLVDQLLPLVK